MVESDMRVGEQQHPDHGLSIPPVSVTGDHRRRGVPGTRENVGRDIQARRIAEPGTRAAPTRSCRAGIAAHLTALPAPAPNLTALR